MSCQIDLQSPRADVKEIKLAYYSIMKDCHPDLSGDEESTEFCMLLNEIYEVWKAHEHPWLDVVNISFRCCLRLCLRAILSFGYKSD